MLALANPLATRGGDKKTSGELNSAMSFAAPPSAPTDARARARIGSRSHFTDWQARGGGQKLPGSITAQARRCRRALGKDFREHLV